MNWTDKFGRTYYGPRNYAEAETEIQTRWDGETPMVKIAERVADQLERAGYTGVARRIRRDYRKLKTLPAWQVESTPDGVFAVYAYCHSCQELLGVLDTDGVIAEWEIEGEEYGEHVYCSSCLKEAQWSDWLEATLDAIESAALDGGWDFHRNRYSGGNNTRSRYYELSRETGDISCEEIKLRVSDHGTVYCREDLSVAMVPSGDDHDLEAVCNRLRKVK